MDSTANNLIRIYLIKHVVAAIAIMMLSILTAVCMKTWVTILLGPFVASYFAYIVYQTWKNSKQGQYYCKYGYVQSEHTEKGGVLTGDRTYLVSTITSSGDSTGEIFYLAFTEGGDLWQTVQKRRKHDSLIVGGAYCFVFFHSAADPEPSDRTLVTLQRVVATVDPQLQHDSRQVDESHIKKKD